MDRFSVRILYFMEVEYNGSKDQVKKNGTEKGSFL